MFICISQKWNSQGLQPSQATITNPPNLVLQHRSTPNRSAWIQLKLYPEDTTPSGLPQTPSHYANENLPNTSTHIEYMEKFNYLLPASSLHFSNVRFPTVRRRVINSGNVLEDILSLIPREKERTATLHERRRQDAGAFNNARLFVKIVERTKGSIIPACKGVYTLFTYNNTEHTWCVYDFLFSLSFFSILWLTCARNRLPGLGHEGRTQIKKRGRAYFGSVRQKMGTV